MNRMGRIFIQILLILFFSLFLSKYSVEMNENKRILTEEAIAEYERDLREGNEIVVGKYQIEEKDYNNRFAKVGRVVSSIIERTFHKGFTYIMKYLKYLEES